jgi:acylphosphatase
VTRRAIRCFVSGRVQGVFYRASAADEAARLGLDGSVRNLADGRVEVIAAGSDDALTELVAWLWKGPTRARVDSVEIEEWREDAGDGFSVVR